MTPHSSGSPTRPTGARLPAVVITCSDSAAAGRNPDTSGPLAVELLAELGHHVTGPVLVSDDSDLICRAVRAARAGGARIVVTTGGTGGGPRDVTPEALRSLGIRELPGLGEAIRAAARAKLPAADLSRALGGLLGDCVVLALPGSNGGVRDGLAAVGGLLGHAAAMASGGGHTHPSGPDTDPVPKSVAGALDLLPTTPLAASSVAAAVASPQAGAVITFVGAVRDHDRDRAVTALRYEAHPDAAAVLRAIVAETAARPEIIGAAAQHRVGDLVVGDLAFVAAVSAAHRGEAFQACSWLVDEVKSRLPVWKHQVFADGTDEWVNCP